VRRTPPLPTEDRSVAIGLVARGRDRISGWAACGGEHVFGGGASEGAACSGGADRPRCEAEPPKVTFAARELLECRGEQSRVVSVGDAARVIGQESRLAFGDAAELTSGRPSPHDLDRLGGNQAACPGACSEPLMRRR
jgi:hypothetical protein